MANSLPLLLFVATFYMAVFSPVFGVISPAFGLPPKELGGKILGGGAQKVTVQNRAGDKRDMWVHCFSGDDDLGVHLLHYWQVFVIQFHASVFKNTEFFCTISWKNIHPKGTKTYHTIAVFKEKFLDDENCGTHYNWGGEYPVPTELPGCTYHIGMNSFSGPDGINPWNQLSRRLIH